MTKVVNTCSSIASQRQVLDIQAYIANELPPVELEYEHLFADGVYARVMKVPANTYVVGKAHRTEHLCILLKGSLSVTMDDGQIVEKHAPGIWVTPPGKKKAAFFHEDTWFVNVHPAETTDLEVIEQKVIIPEDEYQHQLLELEKEMKLTNEVTA